VALTHPKGKVYFVGDKLARTIEIDNSQKFGFHELPVNEDDLYPKKVVVKKAKAPEVVEVVEVVEIQKQEEAVVAMELNDDSEEQDVALEDNEEEELLQAVIAASK
jgi:hypothetical protein